LLKESQAAEKVQQEKTVEMEKSIKEMQNRLKYSHQDRATTNAQMEIFTKKFNGHQV